LEDKFNTKRVLLAPLDWGLGHATRCIPIIRLLLQNKYEVFIATDGAQKILLQQEFPTLQFLKLEGYNVRYAKTRWLLPLKILLQIPKIVRAIKREHHWLAEMIQKHRIDLVISDNRFGLHAASAKCIFITHQLTILLPFRFLERWVQKINYAFINQFTCCWVPDVVGEFNLAGLLSHPPILPMVPMHYLGLLSRFRKEEVAEIKHDYCILLSGPEPQRTVLEEIILKDIHRLKGTVLLVRGKPGDSEFLELPLNIEVKNHLSGNDLQVALAESATIISRSGYTTVMEILSLQKKSILIPTPGQTEQEYLASRLMHQQLCYSAPQDSFDLIRAVRNASQFSYTSVSLPVFDQDCLKLVNL